MNKIFPECLCNEDGSTSISCDDISGNCVCRPNVVGSKCDQCDDSHYDFPDCPGIMIIQQYINFDKVIDFIFYIFL